MTRAEAIAALNTLPTLGFRGGLEAGADYVAHDEGGDTVPFILASEWLSAQPCPFPELIREP